MTSSSISDVFLLPNPASSIIAATLASLNSVAIRLGAALSFFDTSRPFAAAEMATTIAHARSLRPDPVPPQV